MQQLMRARKTAMVQTLARLGRWPGALPVMPAAILGAYSAGGERMLIAAAVVLPLIAVLLRFLDDGPGTTSGFPEPVERPRIVTVLDAILRNEAVTGLTTACIVVQFDDAAQVLDRHGRAAQTEMLIRSADRIATVLRQGDTVARLEGGGFAIAMRAQRRIDLEGLLQIAARLQAALAEPVSIHAVRLCITASVGFCHAARVPGGGAAGLLDAAQVAADEALRHGPGAIRAFAPGMANHRADCDTVRNDVEAALDGGEIRAHFQPQVCTDTGAVSGFEALARWHHPTRGLIAPAGFLPAIEQAGLCERLGEVMLHQALSALVQWDRAGIRVPTVGVNFAAAELRNPRLPERLKWEVDRFGLTPDRLAIEILETVVADAGNDVIVRNIAALAVLGFGIDLDDFGTGHASIANIRRFAVSRIKIDRSFVTRVDSDRDQQKMISAVVSMAEQLGLATLAEGVETPAEHAMLAQLGCRHVQGFGIARPMPFEDTVGWVARAHALHDVMPRIGSRAR